MTMTKAKFKEIVQTKGALGIGYIMLYPIDMQEKGTFIHYTIDYKNWVKADWNKLKERINYTIKELSEAFNTKVTFWNCNIINKTKKYEIVLNINIEYEKLPGKVR